MLVSIFRFLNALKHPAKTPAISLSCFYCKSWRWTTNHHFKSEALSFVDEMKELNSSDWVQLRNCNLGFSTWASQMENAVESKWKNYIFLVRKNYIPQASPILLPKKMYILNSSLHSIIYLSHFYQTYFFSNTHSVLFMGNSNSLGSSKSLPC